MSRNEVKGRERSATREVVREADLSQLPEEEQVARAMDQRACIKRADGHVTALRGQVMRENARLNAERLRREWEALKTTAEEGLAKLTA
jgi:hypothetical protein